jgi:hypothetical protein
MDKNSQRIISDLMIQLGTAIGFLKGLYWQEELPEFVEDCIESMITRLDSNADRILKEINNS